MIPNNVLIVYYVHNYRTLKLVENVLKKCQIRYKATRRKYLSKSLVANRDLIIVVGGDGTFLRTTHHVDDTPVLAVSSDTKFNEAFYSQADPECFGERFGQLLDGDYRIIKLPRLESKINGNKLPFLAMNEVFFGNQHPFHTSRYWLKIKNKTEYQKSSGIIISTARGTTGWAGSAAKKNFKIPQNSFGYVVREPYFGKLTNPKMVQGALPKNATVKVVSDTHKGIVAIDSSDKLFRLGDNDVLETRVSDKPLNYIEFEKRQASRN